MFGFGPLQEFVILYHQLSSLLQGLSAYLDASPSVTAVEKLHGALPIFPAPEQCRSDLYPSSKIQTVCWLGIVTYKNTCQHIVGIFDRPKFLFRSCVVIYRHVAFESKT